MNASELVIYSWVASVLLSFLGGIYFWKWVVSPVTEKDVKRFEEEADAFLKDK